MKLVPYASFEIVTRLAAGEIVAALQDNIEPSRWLRFSRVHKPFQGTITRDGFTVTRIIHYRNSFHPIIRGTFRPHALGVAVAIRMRPHLFVIAFMCVWLGFVGVALAGMVAGHARNPSRPQAVMLVPVAMLLFGCALFTGGFWFEANKAKPILLEMFKGTQTPESSDRPQD